MNAFAKWLCVRIGDVPLGSERMNDGEILCLNVEEQKIKRDVTMKTLTEVFKYVVLGVGITALLTIPMFAQKPEGKVTFTKTRIEIHPGLKLLPSDEKALNDVLKKYDKTLYKIESYENGAVVKTKGELSDVTIDKKLASEVAHAKKTRALTIETVQTVNGRSYTAGEQLLKDLKPILEKYSK